MGHLCWKSDRVCYLFTLELPVSAKEKAVISHLINAPLWITPSDCTEGCLCFCVSEPNRDLAGELFVSWARGLFFSVQEGDVGISSSSSTGWICVDSGLPLSHPVSFPYISSALPLWSPAALYIALLQTIPELLCHQFVFFFSPIK